MTRGLQTPDLKVGPTAIAPAMATAIAIVLLWLTAGAAAQAPARDASQPSVSLTEGTATIRGRVVDAGSGAPLRGVSVRASLNDSVDRSALTNGDGRYEFRNLPAGRYRLTARTEGYLVLDHGQTRPAQAGMPVSIANNQTLESVDFHLPLGGAIAGTVRDEVGDPMANVQVRALRPIYNEGRRILNADAIVVTNDLGEYRLFGLVPGAVYLSVLAPSVTGEQIENSGTGIAPAYFGGSSFAEAQRLTVKLRETVNNADVAVRSVNNGSIRVRVLDGQGQPLANPQVFVSQIGPGLLSGSGARLQPDGSFLAGNLTPGDFDVRVTGFSSTTERIPLVAIVRPNLKDGENLDLRLTAIPMSTGSGRLVIEPSAVRTFAAASASLRVEPDMPAGAVPYQARPSSSRISVRVLPDLTFTFSIPPGRATLLAGALPSGWYLKAVRVNGVDVSEGIEFPESGAVAGIEVELTNRPSQVSGSVRNEKGEVADDYTVLIFAQDPDRRRGITRYFATARPDVTGKFTALGLPAGDYYAIALEYAASDVSADPDFLQPLARDATAFTLVEGEPKTLDLTLIP